jgi:hypothetical protein
MATKAAKKGAKKATAAKPAKRANSAANDEEDEIDEEDQGPEFVEEDLDDMHDDMLAAEDEDEDRKLTDDEVVQVLRRDICAPCGGIAVKRTCKIYDEYKCPPEKMPKSD